MKIFYLLCIAIIFTACQNQPTQVESNPNYYQELHRPQFHFSPEKMWMNDPNGMVFYKDEYHLFYQHYPDSTVWGPMHWGHAVSKDLVHWQHLPIALYPDSLGYIFSGSAVVDINNTAGFKSGEEAPLVAIFTYHNMNGEKAGRSDYQTQGIAYSNDRGRTWTKYVGNPVLKNPGIKDFRDPKVRWDEAAKLWRMAFAASDQILFYSAPDLKNWTQTGSFGKTAGSHGGVWECPDLIQLPIEGTNESKWVLLVSINPGGPNAGSATQYFVGNFDGNTFVNENPDATTLWLDYGADNYAGVTWSNAQEPIFLGWMSNWLYANVVPTETWRSAMTVPRTLRLRRTPQGLRVVSKPIQELENLRDSSANFAPTAIADELDLSEKSGLHSATAELLLEFDLDQTTAETFEIQLLNTKGEFFLIGFRPKQNEFYMDRRNAGKSDFSDPFAKIHVAPRLSDDRVLKLHLYLDVASVELFADDGSTVMTDIFFPSEDFQAMKIVTKQGKVQLKAGKMWTLKSIW